MEVHAMAEQVDSFTHPPIEFDALPVLGWDAKESNLRLRTKENGVRHETSS
jgi:hypothetical protein